MQALEHPRNLTILNLLVEVIIPQNSDLYNNL